VSKGIPTQIGAEKAAPAPLVASVTNLSQVIDKLYHLKLYQVHGFGTHNVSGDSTDCIGSCKYACICPRFLVRFVFFKLFNCMSSHFLVPFCFVLDSCFIYFVCIYLCKLVRGRHDRMVVGFTTTYAISAYHH
jgi:hypothetical protein